MRSIDPDFYGIATSEGRDRIGNYVRLAGIVAPANTPVQSVSNRTVAHVVEWRRVFYGKARTPALAFAARWDRNEDGELPPAAALARKHAWTHVHAFAVFGDVTHAAGKGIDAARIESVDFALVSADAHAKLLTAEAYKAMETDQMASIAAAFAEIQDKLTRSRAKPGEPTPDQLRQLSAAIDELVSMVKGEKSRNRTSAPSSHLRKAYSLA